MEAGELRQFVRPCLLLLLQQRPDHGYALAQRLRPLGVEPVDAGTLYRTLRVMESEGLVSSRWAPADSGPARRVYFLTAGGETVLADEVRVLVRTRATVDRFLRAYSDVRVGPGRWESATSPAEEPVVLPQAALPPPPLSAPAVSNGRRSR